MSRLERTMARIEAAEKAGLETTAQTLRNYLLTADACPKCGWIVDYGCGCPDCRPTFPLVPYGAIMNPERNRGVKAISIRGDVEAGVGLPAGGHRPGVVGDLRGSGTLTKKSR